MQGEVVSVVGCTFDNFECEAIIFAPVNCVNEALPQVTIGEAGPPESVKFAHVGQALSYVLGVDVDDNVDGGGVLHNVMECAELHGVDRNGVVTKNEVGS